jgi:DNA-binding transcriptional regulator YiaG
MQEMTGVEFQAALDELGISQRDFARETGTHYTAVNRWAKGRVPIPGIAAAYVRLRLRLQAADQSS